MHASGQPFTGWNVHPPPRDLGRSATQMSVIACDDRRKLRDAVIAYMNGSIKTYAFDDLNCECMDSNDPGVRQISKLLYQIHDDTVDHPISVNQTTWDTLQRIVAFLDTDLAIVEKADQGSWPFKDENEWTMHQDNMDEANIPPYDPEIHALPVHGPLNRIPTLVGLGIIILATGLLMLFVSIVTR